MWRTGQFWFLALVWTGGMVFFGALDGPITPEWSPRFVRLFVVAVLWRLPFGFVFAWLVMRWERRNGQTAGRTGHDPAG